MPKTLLLADESQTIRRVVELALAGEDVTVVSVADGDQAVVSIQESAPDLVLADIDMPGRTGYDVAQFIRSQPALASLPVLLLAGAFDGVDQARAHTVGADGILTKPFDTAVLRARVHDLLLNGRGGAPVVYPPASVIGAWGTARPSPDIELSEAVVPVAPDLDVPEPPAASVQPDPDSYFAQLDQAFASLATSPRSPMSAPNLEPERADVDEGEPPTGAGGPAVAAAAVGLPDAFAALLDAERDGNPDPFVRVTPQAAPLPAPAPAPPPPLDIDALAEQIARRVLAQLSDRIVRETVTEVVSSTAERLVREEIERIRRTIP